MKKYIFILLAFYSLALQSLSQTIKPVTEKDQYYEEEVQEAIRNYEKYMPEATTVEDTIETLYYKAELYWNIDMGTTGSYSTEKAREYFTDIACLCKKEYGECSVQYIVALSLIDWLGNTLYSYNKRNPQISALINRVYTIKRQQFRCLMYLANLWAIQLREYALMRGNIWFEGKEDDTHRPLSYGFMNICKYIDQSCYGTSVKCDRSFSRYTSSRYYLDDVEEMNITADYVRYFTDLGCSEKYFTDDDILQTVRAYITSSKHIESAVEFLRPLLTIEIPSRAYNNPSCENSSKAYDAALLKKGLLLQTARRKSVLKDKESTIQRIGRNFTKDWSKVYMNRIKLDDKDSIERLENESKLLVQFYAQRFNALGQNTDSSYVDFMTITWQKIQQSLKPKDVAIEFMRLPEDVGTIYYALTLKQGYDYPHFVPLCSESVLAEHNEKNAFADDSVYNAIWKPLAHEIEGAENIYFAADGLLHEIPIEYVPDNQNRPFADALDGRKVYRLSSTREVYLNCNKSKIESAAIYGGIKYAADTLSMKTDAERYARDLLTTEPQNLMFSNERSVNVLRDMTFGYLENTLEEAQNIDERCKSNGIQTSLYIGYDASEPSFKALSGKNNNIVHIATHGFYLEEFAAKDGLTPLSDKYRSNLDRDGNIIDDPMLRSGLLFSGADNILNDVKMPEGVDDGILYSKEVGNLDLHNTDLVVLSACQTAQGKIDSEGVYGLQRGFKQAGVASLLISLWNVNDDATILLMSDFYHQLLDLHKSKYEALQHARQKLSMSPEYSDPRYWAAFILLDP